VTLLRVELRRFASRRAVVVMLLVAVLGVFGTAAGVLWNHQPLTDADRAQAAADAAASNEDPWIVTRVDRCVERSGDRERCEERWLVSPEEFLWQPQLALAAYDDWLVPMAAIVGALLMLVGATFIGADYSSGSLGTQLLFRPRRAHVWTAKATALGLAGAVFTAASLGLANLLMYAFARAWDRPVAAGIVTDMSMSVLRAAVLGGVLAVVGYAIALVTRHTAAALGLIAFYGIAAETLARVVWPGSERWLLSNHVFAYLGGDWTLESYGLCSDADYSSPEGCLPRLVHFTVEGASAYLGLLSLAAVAVSLLVFGRRDVA
jgi:hypothetical protein